MSDRPNLTNKASRTRKNCKELSCSLCRKWHAKCDREKPTCGACMEKNVVCIYEGAPKKRGPKEVISPLDRLKIEQELEYYRRLASFWQDKTQIIEQKRLELISDRDSIIEAKGLFSLNNSILFHSLTEIYLRELFPVYEIHPPFNNLHELDQAPGYSLQRALMYSILATASASSGDTTLYSQLEHETKAAMGPLFDNSNYPEVTCSHFLLGEAQLSLHSMEKAAFYLKIARQSTNSYYQNNRHKDDAQHLYRIGRFTHACMLGWESKLEEALQIVDEFYYSSIIGLSGKEPNYFYQLHIIQMKIVMEIATLLSSGTPVSAKKFTSWMNLMSTANEIISKNYNRAHLVLSQEILQAIIYHAGNQPIFVRECIQSALEIARNMPSCDRYWTAKIMIALAGLCLAYNMPEGLRVAREILERDCDNTTNVVLRDMLNDIVEQYGNTSITFSEFFRQCKIRFDTAYGCQSTSSTSSVIIEETDANNIEQSPHTILAENSVSENDFMFDLSPNPNDEFLEQLIGPEMNVISQSYEECFY